ncbi:hypothetical protein P2G88_01990 [Aliiglaciecola sp. CAU 1673]|uniref:hypothetical protein n=1 Tax=Aliiglaciecola sp. CAU 1673 TaxID=3032595 RepID=UPI0023D990B9|nr:hypothetical protein [Aliiglaciecola sp. CAU 1673]MDF2177022.1 hypothetical protein [Aliiglaciecola sp. CAU 1673]
MSVVQEPWNRPLEIETPDLPQFELWRQDDNANEFLIQTFHCRQEALLKMGRLAMGGHKQLYWIKSRAS